MTETTKFKLVAADGGIVGTAPFNHFDGDSAELRRARARAHIQHQKEPGRPSPCS